MKGFWFWITGRHCHPFLISNREKQHQSLSNFFPLVKWLVPNEYWTKNVWQTEDEYGKTRLCYFHPLSWHRPLQVIVIKHCWLPFFCKIAPLCDFLSFFLWPTLNLTVSFLIVSSCVSFPPRGAWGVAITLYPRARSILKWTTPAHNIFFVGWDGEARIWRSCLYAIRCGNYCMFVGNQTFSFKLCDFWQIVCVEEFSVTELLA